VVRRVKAGDRTGASFDSGFTLAEILAALAVMAVATSVFVSMFTSALGLAQMSRNTKVAVDLADTQLQHIVRNPNLYVWPGLQAFQSGELAPVHAAQKDGDGKFSLPAVMPLTKAARQRETAFYGKFTWDAYARMPNPQASYAEVTVVVRWLDRGRERVLALTSSVPKTVIGGVS